jgi:hypothetical protein
MGVHPGKSCTPFPYGRGEARRGYLRFTFTSSPPFGGVPVTTAFT